MLEGNLSKFISNHHSQGRRDIGKLVNTDLKAKQNYKPILERWKMIHKKIQPDINVNKYIWLTMCTNVPGILKLRSELHILHY
jgi:hypothetical protein